MFKSWQKNTKFWFSRFSTWKTYFSYLNLHHNKQKKYKILARLSIKDSLDSDGIAGQRASSYTKVNSQNRGFLDGINNNSFDQGQPSHGGHRLWLDLVRNGLHQVYLLMTGYTWMNTSPAFKLRYVEGTGQGLNYAVTLWPHLLMEMVIVWRVIIWKKIWKKKKKQQNPV